MAKEKKGEGSRESHEKNVLPFAIAEKVVCEIPEIVPVTLIRYH